MNITELAQMLSDEIDKSGKTRWSAKDVKEFFLSMGIDIPLYTILEVWDACPNPVCASELLDYNNAIFASENLEQMSFNDYYHCIVDALSSTLADTEDDYGRQQWCYKDPDPSGRPVWDYVPVEDMTSSQIEDLKEQVKYFLNFIYAIDKALDFDSEDFEDAFFIAFGEFEKSNLRA